MWRLKIWSGTRKFGVQPLSIDLFHITKEDLKIGESAYCQYYCFSVALLSDMEDFLEIIIIIILNLLSPSPSLETLIISSYALALMTSFLTTKYALRGTNHEFLVLRKDRFPFVKNI
ncbi:hypothetical protein Leryth_018760 [Lithospermum erythrorhizon]|nr:hypothetical protein Leryth_018760 [Lithospermum erythrorhizon]